MDTNTDVRAVYCSQYTHYRVDIEWKQTWFLATCSIDARLMAQAVGETVGEALERLGELMQRERRRREALGKGEECIANEVSYRYTCSRCHRPYGRWP